MEQDDVAPTGRIMLHEHAKSGAKELVLAVLDEKSASVDERSSLGDTALIWAARGNHVSTIEALAARGGLQVSREAGSVARAAQQGRQAPARSRTLRSHQSGRGAGRGQRRRLFWLRV